MDNSRFSDPDQLKSRIRQIDHANVDGNLFVEVLLAGLRLNNAAELARKLPVAPAVLSRIRTGRAVSDEMLLKLHLAFGMSVSGLKDLLCACNVSDMPITMQRIDALASKAVFIQRAPTEQERLAA
jgi:plasmid maintenance system antidote protein VapI